MPVKTTLGRVAIVACLFVVFDDGTLEAIPAIWTNGAGTNAWETAGNWDINMVPNNNTFDAMLPIASPCNLTGQFQINSLDLSLDTANLNLIPGALLAFSNGATNNGTILVNTTGVNTTTGLRLDANGAISGSGNVLLNGVGFNVATIDLQAFVFTNGTNHTIQGTGTVIGYNGGTLINNGAIVGDDPAGNIQLDLGNTPNENHGTLKAAGG